MMNVNAKGGNVVNNVSVVSGVRSHLLSHMLSHHLLLSSKVTVYARGMKELDI